MRIVSMNSEYEIQIIGIVGLARLHALHLSDLHIVGLPRRGWTRMGLDWDVDNTYTAFFCVWFRNRFVSSCSRSIRFHWEARGCRRCEDTLVFWYCSWRQLCFYRTMVGGWEWEATSTGGYYAKLHRRHWKTTFLGHPNQWKCCSRVTIDALWFGAWF